MADEDVVTVRSRAELRAWLADHHESGSGVWIETFKKHHPDHVPFGEVVEELICWGWVDSQVRGVDEDRSAHRISPRSPTSAWSAVNKEIVRRMRSEGRMTPAGEALVEAAKSNGMWEFLDDVERLEVPDDLAAALGDLRTVWEAWPRSIKRGALEWIKTAKRAPTRTKRITDVVESARAGLRPTPFR